MRQGWSAMISIRELRGWIVVPSGPSPAADHESLGAAYLTLDEIRALPLRGSDLGALLESVAAGRQVFPLDLLGPELSV